MSWFARIEETCAAFVERAFANMFPSDLEPAQIARKLVATMEARTQFGENGMRAPSRYSVYVNAGDYDRLSPHKAYLEEEWGALLGDVAHRVGIGFAAGPPIVQMLEDPGVVAGGIDIAVSSGAPDEPVAVSRDRAEPYALRMLKGMPTDAVYRIDGATRVGRNSEMEIFLVDPSVSRNHALLDVRDGDLIVRDAGSTNGTFVNGERIDTRTLRPGDRVAFGKTEMLVEKSPA